MNWRVPVALCAALGIGGFVGINLFQENKPQEDDGCFEYEAGDDWWVYYRVCPNPDRTYRALIMKNDAQVVFSTRDSMNGCYKVNGKIRGEVSSIRYSKLKAGTLEEGCSSGWVQLTRGKKFEAGKKEAVKAIGKTYPAFKHLYEE